MQQEIVYKRHFALTLESSARRCRGSMNLKGRLTFYSRSGLYAIGAKLHCTQGADSLLADITTFLQYPTDDK